jgi:hypothetical protein
VEIIKAIYEDLPEILNLQKLTYLNEAKLLNDYSIQPLKQTLDELNDEFEKKYYSKINSIEIITIKLLVQSVHMKKMVVFI